MQSCTSSRYFLLRRTSPSPTALLRRTSSSMQAKPRTSFCEFKCSRQNVALTSHGKWDDVHVRVTRYCLVVCNECKDIGRRNRDDLLAGATVARNRRLERHLAATQPSCFE